MYLALRKCKNDCKILTFVLLPDFCPLKLLDFLSNFVLTSTKRGRNLKTQHTGHMRLVGWICV